MGTDSSARLGVPSDFLVVASSADSKLLSYEPTQSWIADTGDRALDGIDLLLAFTGPASTVTIGLVTHIVADSPPSAAEAAQLGFGRMVEESEAGTIVLDIPSADLDAPHRSFSRFVENTGTVLTLTIRGDQAFLDQYTDPFVSMLDHAEGFEGSECGE